VHRERGVSEKIQWEKCRKIKLGKKIETGRKQKTQSEQMSLSFSGSMPSVFFLSISIFLGMENCDFLKIKLYIRETAPTESV